jgi:hypothetical protein
MILTQTSIERQDKLLTFQLQERPEKSKPPWRSFRIIRLDYTPIARPRRRKWYFGFDGARFGSRQDMTSLRRLFPEIYDWIKTEITPTS